ncbi:hypothetical protein [Natronorubrum texcoconense]|uniref:Uncharacterized protein n=1 Tax=Natronorubrum texcoconense TaxID=1095776 RepID=A0A1G8U9G1_9EURY|nr:hypothetical protein [Natronorubrum texcoconense]SDJ50381.1 hypothetical protein SAMN04515672_0792 [Natronorubrum texcoconense]
MATASRQEGRAVTERLRHLVTDFSATFPITFNLAADAPMRGDTRARVGHTLWS